MAGDVPDSLQGCRVYALDLTSLVAGAKYRGEFEERLKGVVDEVSARQERSSCSSTNSILWLAPEGGGRTGCGEYPQTGTGAGELRCIGATTYDEYRERIEQDAALARRFERVVVEEPDDAATLTARYPSALRSPSLGATLGREPHHRCPGFPAVICVTASCPTKAIDVLDEATAACAQRIKAERHR